MDKQDRNEDTSGKKPLNKNEGEGSTSAANKYDRELEEFKETSDVEKLADEAARELEDEDLEDEEKMGPTETGGREAA